MPRMENKVRRILAEPGPGSTYRMTDASPLESSSLTLTRRRLLKLSAGALAASTLPWLGCRPRSKPDVLFLVADDLNDWTGCLGGHPQAKTPNLDRLASQGALFRSAHCAAPSCNPSRTSILTGIPAEAHGVFGNSIPFRQHLPNAVTLPQHFMRHGYRVLGCGKIFHDSDDEPSWHEYYWPEVRWPNPRPHNGISQRFDWGPDPYAPLETTDGQLVTWAKKKLQEPRRQQPLFLAVGFNHPHLPWFAPRDFFAPFPPEATRLPAVREDDLDDLPPAGRALALLTANDHRQIVQRGLWHEAVSAYLACGHYLDWLVGEVLQAFEPRRQDGGIVVFWSDHGFHLGQKQHWRKWTLWHESTRVPVIFSAPGRIDSGVRCDRPVSMTAIGATLAELCGLPGRWGNVPSFTRLLSDPSDSSSPPAVTALNRHLTLCTDRWRYIHYHDGDEELYDLGRDPLEWTNLASSPQHRATKAQLAAQLPHVRRVISEGHDDADH